MLKGLAIWLTAVNVMTYVMYWWDKRRAVKGKRRVSERELLAFYLDALASHGVQPVPTFDEAWLLYRQTAIWGLVIGWLITPPENYGEAITTANLKRLIAAVQDLEPVRALAQA